MGRRDNQEVTGTERDPVPDEGIGADRPGAEKDEREGPEELRACFI
jgi:hypothetical protein